jgi:hypothetical protein
MVMKSRNYVVVGLLGLVLVSPIIAVAQTTTVTPPAAPAAPAVTPTAPAVTAPAPATPPAAVAPVVPEVAPVPGDQTDPSAADTEGDMSVGEIATVETEELTADMARKALDAYVLVQDKYKDSPLADYQDLQEFVDKDPRGKEMETDIKGFGFKDVNDWNLAVTTLGVSYNNQLNDQTTDIKQQIDEIKADTTMAQDMKDRMVKNLEAMIPSENNRKIVEDLTNDTTYGEKVKLLESTDE